MYSSGSGQGHVPGPSEHGNDPASSRLAEELLAHTESVPWG